MRDERLLITARKQWDRLSDYRLRRERYKNYTFGKQWGDTVRTSDGRIMTEGEYLSESGNKPYTNNLIRQLVKAIVGRYRTVSADNKRYAGEEAERNNLSELDARALEEFLISGGCVQRTVMDRRGGAKMEKWVDNVNPGRFFCTMPEDPRGYDLTMAGMAHDLRFGELVRRFGGWSGHSAIDLGRIYRLTSEGMAFGREMSDIELIGSGFYSAETAGKCRIFEIWTIDYSKPGKASQPLWQCRWLAPDGTVIADYPSPYRHGSHPYVMKFYPLLDGEIHPFVEDIIDQQRFINRIVVLMDRMLSSSAKGVLLYPVDQLPRGWNFDRISELWAKSNSIIPVRGQGIMPQQVIHSGLQEGAWKLLDLQMKMMESVSGIGDALLGRNLGGNAGAEKYEQAMKNSSISIADLTESFESFVKQRDIKLKGI